MNRFTKTFLRYGVVVVALTIPFVIEDGVAGLLGILLAALLSIKFLIYDGVVGLVKDRINGFKYFPWYMAGYIVTAAYDIYAFNVAIFNEGNQGLAILGPILLSPWFLALAFFAMVAHTYIVRRRTRKVS